jgi:hypothetical protein
MVYTRYMVCFIALWLAPIIYLSLICLFYFVLYIKMFIDEAYPLYIAKLINVYQTQIIVP